MSDCDWTIARQAPVHGVLKARILQWVAMLEDPDTLVEPGSLGLAGVFFTTSTSWEAQPHVVGLTKKQVERHV